MHTTHATPTAVKLTNIIKAVLSSLCDLGSSVMETPALPLEVLAHILSFLNPTDRKEASLVCRSWYEGSQDHQFQKNVTFKFPATWSSLEFICGLARRKRCGLVISHLNSSSLSRQMLEEVGTYLGPRLESLALHGSSITEASLLDLLLQLTSLRKLDLSGLDSLFMSGDFLCHEDQRQQVHRVLTNLEELNLSDLRHLSDLTFNRLASCIPRLRRLALAGCNISSEFDPYLGGKVGPGCSTFLSLRNLKRFLRQQFSSLRSLDLSRTSITSESLCTLVQTPGLCLEELTLRACEKLTDYGIETLTEWHRGIWSLDLSNCEELSSHSVQAIAANLKELRSLTLSSDWRVSEDGMVDLMTLPELRSLDLSECVHVSGDVLVKGISVAPTRTQLRTLSLRCTYIKDDTVCSLAQLLGCSLRELDLTSCVYLTDLSVRAIASYLPELCLLRLGWCKEITDWGLLGVVEPSSKYESNKETTHSLQFQESQGKPSLLSLKNLTELDLSSCSKLTDTSITEVLRFPMLQSLSLSILPEISDECLVTVARHCGCLSSLALSCCERLTDEGMARVLPHLPRLQHLQVAGCNLITDRSLTLIAKHSTRLKTLDVSMCKDITIEKVNFLQSQLPFLEKVQFRHLVKET